MPDALRGDAKLAELERFAPLHFGDGGETEIADQVVRVPRG
jgi:hypothetical protein